MYDPEADLDDKLFALFIRQHELRVRLRQSGCDVNADWETLHKKIDLLSEARICLAHQPEEARVEEWIAMSDLADAIVNCYDQLEASMESTSSSSCRRESQWSIA